MPDAHGSRDTQQPRRHCEKYGAICMADVTCTRNKWHSMNVYLSELAISWRAGAVWVQSYGQALSLRGQ